MPFHQNLAPGLHTLVYCMTVLKARDASGNNDTLKAFQQINTADTELLKVTQKLPAEGD
jgi:hypothetical protein